MEQLTNQIRYSRTRDQEIRKYPYLGNNWEGKRNADKWKKTKWPKYLRIGLGAMNLISIYDKYWSK